MPSSRSLLFYALPSLVALCGLVYFTYSHSTQTPSRKKKPSKKRRPPCTASTSVYSFAHSDGLASSYIEPPPSTHKRRLSSTATVSRTEVRANMKEIETHFDAYEHLVHLPREKEALVMLRKAASAVKPLMRKRGWKIATLAEFLPEEPNLLGLNINRTERILIRLRYHHDSRQFLPMEQVTDTLLHELSHIVFGPHDHNFNNLWNELRDEHQTLLAKGYTGEGFLGGGQKLGGKRIPLEEMRRQARIAAEKRKATTNANAGGHRLGGSKVVRGIDMRKVIADAATRRTSITDGCASGSNQAGHLNQQAEQGGFRTRANEDDANDQAIAQALSELMEEEEMARLEDLCAPSGDGGLAWDRQNGLQFDNQPPLTPTSSRDTTRNAHGRPISRLVLENQAQPQTSSRPKSTTRPSSHLISQPEQNHRINKSLPPSPPLDPVSPTISTDPSKWACPQCTLLNSLNYLSCEACGLEQPPQPIPQHERYGPSGNPTRLPQPPPAAGMRGPGASPFEKANGRMGWNCLNCGTFMENQWWACSLCGEVKVES